MSPHSIHDTEPAARWEDAFLSGNGEYGIMVYGEPWAERVVFSHHRCVLPNGTRDLPPPAIADRVERIRDLILAGEAAEAQREAAAGRELAWTQSFHPGHAMTSPEPRRGVVREYTRITDFATGEITVTWAGDRGKRSHRSFVSRADALVVQRLTGPGLDVRLRLTGDLPGRPADVGYASSAYAKDGRVFLNVRGTYPEGLGAYGFEGLTLVLASGGSVAADGDAVDVRGAHEVLLLSKLDRYDTPGWGTAELEKTLIGLAGSPYAELLGRHTAIHSPVYRRVGLGLDLDAGSAERALPVGRLIAEPGPALLERLFHSGRYLLLSSAGVLPPRLTGLWIGAWGAAWAGDFTTDANLNLQMAGANIGAMPELMDGYAALILGQVRDWQVNAREIYGTRGVLAPGRTDGEHGRLFHLNEDWPWTMWLAGADWLLYPMYEHYLVTGRLIEELPRWLGEAALFFEDFLTRTDDEGHVVVVPSFSPEIGPGGGPFAAVNATMDVAAARHALTVGASLGLEGSQRWAELLDRLPPYLIDERGALAEWAWPGSAPHEDHRHVSHLYPVWPLHEINPDDTPALAAAAHRALELRGDENLSAHGSLHRALAAARLKDGELAHANLDKILGNDMLFCSLMTSHNPGLDIYNADAAHTLPGLIIEMLVDSRPGVVELLPALPGHLTRGAVRGITCRGRITVDELRWGGGTVRAVLRSAIDQRVTLIHRRSAHRAAIDLVAGEPHVVEIEEP